ncbi:hypothetical protein [Marinomonas sp. 2405UD68-3]|uniref:hypothetical protein n=1 Tax=Marinomonas sp. 2405UD68-3 TaxID=3391835 RepID=UPI0039C9CF86
MDASRVGAPSRSKGAGAGRSGRTREILVSFAEGLGVERQVMIEGASVEQGYQEALAMYVQGEHDQVESIEDRLESLIDRQQA